VGGADSLGIPCDAVTWFLALAAALLWIISVRLCFRSGRAGWQAIPLSLFGFAWAGFGISYIARFVVLAIDSVTYGNKSTRLVTVTQSSVNQALMLVVLFWAALSFGYSIVVRRKGPGPFAVLNRTDEVLTTGKADFLIVLSVLAILSINLTYFPRALVTPLGLLGQLWMPVAVMQWCQDDGPLRHEKGARIRRWAYLFPGLLWFYLDPYRERLIQIGVILFIAAIFHGRRIRLATVVLGGVIFFLTITVLTTAYRETVWGGGPSDTELKITSWSDWMDDPYTSPWAEALRRFHALDSLILTIKYVPDRFPYQERNLLVETFVRAFVPRALYPDKRDIARGRIFATTIWGYGDQPVNAMIAPSIVGDLYSVYGSIPVIGGGLAWGLLLGVLEGWKDKVRRPYGLLILMFLGLSFATGVEQDFAHATATILQKIVVFVSAFMLLLPSKTIIRPALANGFSAEPGLKDRLKREETA
jgi:hypothetical protein